MDVGSFLEKLVPLVTADLEKKGVAPSRGRLSGAWTVDADPRALQQALLNIIVNASEALANGPTPRIVLSVLKVGSMVRFRVADNGIGITEERKKQLFKPFYTTKEQGTGLGLVITRKLVSRMKGFIEITSCFKNGTTVDIYLPEGSMSVRTSRQKILLVIDDDKIYCEAVRDYLSRDSVQVLMAHSAKEGLALLRARTRRCRAAGPAAARRRGVYHLSLDPEIQRADQDYFRYSLSQLR